MGSFMASQASAEGMKALYLKRAQTCAVTGNVEYIERDGKKLRLQILRPAPKTDEQLVSGSQLYRQPGRLPSWQGACA